MEEIERLSKEGKKNGMNGWRALGFNSYGEYLKSDLWRKKRENILDILGRKCNRCKTKYSLIIHHITYDSVGNEKMEDVEVLCYKCHREEHGK